MAQIDYEYYSGDDRYSDGDIENEIVDYLKNPSLRENPEKVFETDTRWPVFYYLCHIRENILYWYPFRPDSSVLEIGAGFGAVTGVLCDRCASVTAVELSGRRAQGLYERHKNRENLHVMVGNFNDMEFTQKFDYITLIGVLEYAASFTDSENPFEDFLKKIRSLLKPDGKLLIAIENRFGLKYWCGACEDHTGVPFDGVNGYEGIDFVKTFSKTALAELLQRSGYAAQDFYYPYPDYKLPQAIYSDRYLPDSSFVNNIREFYLEAKLFTAQERRIIGDIVDNGVFPFFSNSFFVEASLVQEDSGRRVNAAFFGSDRRAAYRIGTVLFENGTVLKFPLSAQAQEHIAQAHQNYLWLTTSGLNVLREQQTERGLVSEFCKLETFEKVLQCRLRRGQKKEAEELLSLFLEQILRSSPVISGEGIEAVLTVAYLDMTFSNCFIDGDQLIFFDQEWQQEGVTAGYVFYRALNGFFAHYREDKWKQTLFERFGLIRHLEEYAAQERRFCEQIFDPAIAAYLDAHTYRYSKKLGQLMADAAAQAAESQTQIQRLSEQIASLENQKSEIEKLYYDTNSYLNGIVRDPALLGRRSIAKAFIKCFFPSLVWRAGRKLLRGLRALRRKRLCLHSDYELWIRASAERIKERESLSFQPLISILVPLYNTDPKLLSEMIESCLAQTYENFELCMVDASDEAHPAVFETASGYAARDQRVKLRRLDKNAGIAGNTNACYEMAKGDYIALLDHDDLLLPHALYSVVKAINRYGCDVCYSDEDHLCGKKRCKPFFKPDFNRDLLYSQMYICHLLCFKKELFELAGKMRDDFSGSQDYDLVLRLSEQTDKIYHIPDVLYTWRETESSTSLNPDSKPYAHSAGRMALDSHLKRRYGEQAYAADGPYTFVFDARFPLPQEKPLISIIIPTKDHCELLEPCVESILELSDYERYEVLILDNNSELAETFACFERLQKKDERVRVIKAEFSFNWSKLNNFGIEHSHGEVFVFLNNDTRVISPDWLTRLAENALRKDVGVVGALLLYDDDTIQHAGVVVGMNGWADHVFKAMPQYHAADPFVSPMLSRDVLAVTGACMAVSRETVERIGTFDERFIVCGSDVELCVRAWQNGLNVLYDANVRLYHLESKTRDAADIPEIDFIRSEELYRPFLQNGDPYYNRNLDVNSTTPRIRI